MTSKNREYASEIVVVNVVMAVVTVQEGGATMTALNQTRGPEIVGEDRMDYHMMRNEVTGIEIGKGTLMTITIGINLVQGMKVT